MVDGVIYFAMPRSITMRPRMVPAFIVEDGVDIAQWPFGHFRRHFSFGGELERLFQIFARAHQRAHHLNAVQHRARNAQIHARRRPTATTLPPARTAFTAELKAAFATAVTTAA